MLNPVAAAIYQQLGGKTFHFLTGAKDFVQSDTSLQFRLPARTAKDGINKVVITLTADDLYRVEMLRVRGHTFTTVHDDDGMYNDMLMDHFERCTGLYVSMRART